MPYKPLKPCSYPGCDQFTATAWCTRHTPARPIDERESASMRGYDASWRKKRENVLRRYGIPKGQWPLYDIDHDPPYDKDVDPDHDHYELTPRLHSDHARKTAKHDGGFGNRKT